MVNIAKQKHLGSWGKAFEIQPSGGGERITVVISVEAYQGALQIGVTTTDGPVPPNLVRWLDKEAELQPKDYKLFSSVWRSRNSRVRIRRILKRLQQKGKKQMTEGALTQSVQRIRRTLTSELPEFPYELSLKKDGSGVFLNGWLIISDVGSQR